MITTRKTSSYKYFDKSHKQVSKLLVEVEEYVYASSLLQQILDNNEKNPEIVYLLAFSKWKQGFYSESLKIAQGIINMPEAKADQVYIKI